MKLHYRKICPAEFSCLLSYPKSTGVRRSEGDLCWCGSRNLAVTPQPDCVTRWTHASTRGGPWCVLAQKGGERRQHGAPAARPVWSGIPAAIGLPRPRAVLPGPALGNGQAQATPPQREGSAQRFVELTLPLQSPSPSRPPLQGSRGWQDTTSPLPPSSARCLKCHLCAASRRQVGWQLQGDIYECLDCFIPYVF